MCCCHEHKNDDCGCGCMRIYHLMDDGGECTDKAILCRLDDMKKDECGKKQDDCGCEKARRLRSRSRKARWRMRLSQAGASRKAGLHQAR